MASLRPRCAPAGASQRAGGRAACPSARSADAEALTRPPGFALSARSIIFCEATAIYGVIVAIILQTKIDEVPRNADGSFLSAAVFSGYAVFASGCTVGLANLACGCASLQLARRSPPAAGLTGLHAAGCAWASSAARAR